MASGSSIKLYYYSSFILLSLILNGCIKHRPAELARAEQELLAVAEDEFVVQNSPVILEQAAKAYHNAEITWRNTASTEATVPLAELASELINDARHQANVQEKAVIESTPEISARASLKGNPLLLEKRTGLAQFSDDASTRSSFSTNRIRPDDIEGLRNEKELFSESLESELFFLPGDTAITPTGSIALIPITDYLKSNVSLKLIVEIQTSQPEDLILAAEQANTIRNFFIARGISPERIKAEGASDADFEERKLAFRYFSK